MTNFGNVASIGVERIQPNPWNRKHFQPLAMKQLMASIASSGIQEPLVVRPRPKRMYEIASGNRRWLAAKELGLKEVPCLVMELSDSEVQDMNLVTNIQREDLSPLEKARMLRDRMEQGNLTPEEAAAKVGKSRPWAVELLSFLEMPADVLAMLEDAPLSIRALRGLVALDDAKTQRDIAKRIKKGEMQASEVEGYLREHLQTHNKDPLSAIWNKVSRSAEGSFKAQYVEPGHWRLDIVVEPEKASKELASHLKRIIESLESN